MTSARETRHVDTVVVGGSQAGLAVGYHLARDGRSLVILDAHGRVGDAWRQRWDSLRVFTTARYDRLPGMPFPAPAASYPTKDDVADYLEAYARRFALPVLTGVHVERLSRDGERFELTARGRTFTADNVVVATGAYHRPRIPAFADELDPRIRQLHSGAYRRPDQLADGGVLVVGAGNSGAEIALEVSRHHPTWLSGRDTGQEPTRAGSLPDRVLQPAMWLMASRVLTTTSPIGRKVRDHFLHPPRGIPLGRVRRRDIAAAGVTRMARTIGVRHGAPVLEDGTVLDVANVIWCTGFDPDLSWIDLPITDLDGYPVQERGVVTSQPGLYVVGLPFLHSLSSGLIGGVGRDAAYVARHIRGRGAAHPVAGDPVAGTHART